MLGKSALVVALAAILYTAYSTVFFESSPVVTLEDGKVQGRVAFSRGGREYFQYLGIPFAQPPVRKLRFEPPLPAKSWSGVKQVTSYPPYCAQYDGILLARGVGTEDCLYLNVFTPSVTPKAKKPVLVFIHGGGFMAGASSMYRPNYFMDEDVVIVTMNYRLGPLGFLNTGDDLIRGNQGLKDQNLALRWIQKNIDKFGGNPNQVTISGESAGAASVQNHILSKASQGLFQRAIVQSGAVTCPWALNKDPKGIALKFGKLVGCPTESMKEMVECFRNMDPFELGKPQLQVMNPLNGFELIGPSVESVVTEDTFLSENPRELLKKGSFSKVPLMIGVTTAEGGLRTARLDAMPELIPEMENDFSKHIGSFLMDDPFSRTAAEKVRNFYFGSASFTEDPHEFQRNITKAASDRGFIEPVRRAAISHAKGGAPTYLYLYDYEEHSLPKFYSVFRAVREDDWMVAEVKILTAGVVDWFKKNVLGWRGPHEFGATHADDLVQLWNSDGVIHSAKDLEFSMKFVKLFVDFAKNEEPLQFDGVTWPQISPDHSKTSPLQYMHIKEGGKVISEPFTERMEFWQGLKLDD